MPRHLSYPLHRLLPALLTVLCVVPDVAGNNAVLAARTPTDTPQNKAECDYTQADSLYVVTLLKEGAQAPHDEPLTLFFARKLLHRPYGGAKRTPSGEQLTVCLSRVDCVTLVEHVMALAITVANGSQHWDDYLHWLRMLRYQDGRLAGYSSRNHDFSQWIQSGERLGLMREVMPDSATSVPMKLTLNYMSKHPDAYPVLKSDATQRRLIAEMERKASGSTVRYIPKTRVGDTREALGKCIQNGDILAITTNKAGLDVSHVGFAVWGEDGKLHLLNASSLHRKVVLEPQTLFQYMQRQPSQTGIRVVRPMLTRKRETPASLLR